MKYFLIALVLFFLSCVSTHLPAPKLSDESASVLLDKGFYALQKGDYKGCAEAFRLSIATGDLNDAGRALAYWYIYFALEQTGGHLGSLEALSSFLVVAEDVLDTEGTHSLTQDFVKSFDLVRRMARGRAVLAAAWASQNQVFGRSMQQPVPIFDPEEVAYFLELAPPCTEALDRRISEVFSMQETAIQQVNIRCLNGTQSVDYFFRLSGF